jgi:hypothetical protein
VSVLSSCGCRQPAGQRLDLAPFTVSYPETLTWCDPAAGTVGRGPLAQTPVFYSQTAGDGVRFSTVLPDLITPDTPPHAGVAAALLAGLGVPAALTPFRGVYRLPAAAVLSLAAGQVRVSLTDFDWTGLAPARRGSQTAESLIMTALAAAAAESGACAVAVSGGAASAALARVASAAGLAAVHVAVGLPVLDRRGELLGGEAKVTDGSPQWQEARDAARLPLPEHCDPWPLATGCARVLSGEGMAAVLGLRGAAAPRPSWWQRGWRAMSADLAKSGRWQAHSGRRASASP